METVNASIRELSSPVFVAPRWKLCTIKDLRLLKEGLWYHDFCLHTSLVMEVNYSERTELFITCLYLDSLLVSSLIWSYLSPFQQRQTEVTH